MFVAYQLISPLFSLYSGIWAGFIFIKDVFLKISSVRFTLPYADTVTSVAKDLLTNKIGVPEAQVKFEDL